MKKWLYIFTPVLITLALSAWAASVIKPWLKNYISHQIQVITESDKSPVIVKFKDLHLNLLPLSVEIDQTEVKSKNPEWGFDNIQIQKTQIYLDFFQILTGRLFVHQMLIDGVHAKIDMKLLPQSEEPSPVIPWKLIFQNLRKVPAKRLTILNSDIILLDLSKQLNLQLHLQSFDTRITKEKIFLESLVQVEATNTETLKFVSINVENQIQITPESILIDRWTMTTENSSFKIQGRLLETEFLLQDPFFVGSVEGQIPLTSFSPIFESFKIPALKGRIDLHSTIQTTKWNQWQAEGKIRTQDLAFADYSIGNIQASWKLNKKKLQLMEAQVQHPSGSANLDHLHLDLEKPYNFSGQVHLGSLDLHSLLVEIKVGDIPLQLGLSSQLRCEGHGTDFFLRCDGKVQGQKLFVHQGDKSQTPIVKVPKILADGYLTVDANEVRYQAKANTGKSDGESQGVISYKKGFQIGYSSPAFDFSDIENLANLKFSGITKIQGTTEGDSSAATMQMKLNPKDFIFENYQLGEASLDLSYKKGLLSFNDIRGQIHSSHYQANVAVDLSKSRIQFDGFSHDLETMDALFAFEKIFKMPVPISGRGKINVRGEGPFDFSKMSYDFQSDLFIGSIANERFDQARFHVQSHDGEVKITDAFLVSKDQRINVSGEFHPDAQSSLILDIPTWSLESSENIRRISKSVHGLFHGRVLLDGHILHPTVRIQGLIDKAMLEDQEMDTSVLDLEINAKRMRGKLDLLSGQIKGSFEIPWQPGSPLDINFQTQNLAFAKFFLFLGASPTMNEYQSIANGSFQLHSESGNWKNVNGVFEWKDFLLQRGRSSLKNKSPMRLLFKDGKMSFQDFSVEGEDSIVQLVGENFTAENLKFSFISKLNLRLLQIFFPFMDEFGGHSDVTVDVRGPYQKPEILGQGHVQNAFVRLKGLPHSFEKIESSIVFSLSKILIEDLRAQFGGGLLKGDGEIAILGPQNLPLRITANLTRITLNIPDKVKTSGDAQLNLHGSWFPYTLSGTYVVNDGLITKDFVGSDAETNVQQSQYLPKTVETKSFEPLLLDLNLQLKKPLMIKNEQVQGLVNGDLRIQGPPSKAILLGQIEADKAMKIVFRDKSFDLITAKIKFEDPNELNPELFISARTRIQNYDIQLMIQGTGKAPVFQMSSSPPLSENDIVALIAFGITSQKLDSQVDSKEQGAQTAAQIGSAILSQNPLNKKIQNTLGIEVQLTSSFDDAKNITVPKLTATKKLTDKLTATASRKWGEQTSSDVKLQYFFNQNVSTVGSWEHRENNDPTSIQTGQRQTEILGIDLDFKKEFK